MYLHFIIGSSSFADSHEVETIHCISTQVYLLVSSSCMNRDKSLCFRLLKIGEILENICLLLYLFAFYTMIARNICRMHVPSSSANDHNNPPLAHALFTYIYINQSYLKMTWSLQQNQKPDPSSHTKTRLRLMNATCCRVLICHKPNCSKFDQVYRKKSNSILNMKWKQLDPLWNIFS